MTHAPPLLLARPAPRRRCAPCSSSPSCSASPTRCVVVGVGQLACPRPGRRLAARASTAGSSAAALIGQAFTDADGNPVPQYFQSRPSAAGDGYDPTATAASNLGPEQRRTCSPAVERAPRGRGRRARRRRPGSDVPAGRVHGAAASGLDPHISPAYAALQVARVAAARGLPTARGARAWSTQHTDGPRRSASSASPGQRAASSTSPSTSAPTVSTLTGGRTAADGCGSTSAPRPASARPTPCSARRHRRAERGTDVVVGLVETHGRPHTAASWSRASRSLPRRGRRPPRREVHRDGRRRRAGPPAPRSRSSTSWRTPTCPARRNAKRWQDVEELLDAGIDVSPPSTCSTWSRSTTSSRRSPASRSARPSRTRWSARADQVELVDMTPEALRRRMAHGNVYPPRRSTPRWATTSASATSPRCASWPCCGSPTRSTTALQRYRAEHGIDGTWETRERVVVALTGGAEGDTLIRRAARIAARGAGGDLLAVHVGPQRRPGRRRPGRSPSSARWSRASAAATTRSSATTSPRRCSTSPAARTPPSSSLGASRRGRLAAAARRGRRRDHDRESGVDRRPPGHPRAGRRGPAAARLARRPVPRGAGSPGCARRRRRAAAADAAAGDLRGQLSLTSDTPALPAARRRRSRCSAASGRRWSPRSAARCCSTTSSPRRRPLHDRRAGEPPRPAGLRPGRGRGQLGRRPRRPPHPPGRPRRAPRPRPSPTCRGSVLRGDGPLPALLDRLRETFGLDSVTPARTVDDGRRRCVGARPAVARAPERADDRRCRSRRRPCAWCCAGDRWRPSDRRVLEAFAAQAAVVARPRPARRRGRRGAARSPRPTGCAPRCSPRSATTCAPRWPRPRPRSPACAATTSTSTADDRAELLATAEESLDQLAGLVANLLDMSRLQAGALGVHRADVALEDVVPRPRSTTSGRDRRSTVDLPTTCPRCSPTRACWSASWSTCRQRAAPHARATRRRPSTASCLGDRVELRVIDHGPGIAGPRQATGLPAVPAPRRPRQPHRRRPRPGPLRGLTEAMGGTLTPEDTPGGGLTMIVSLPVARPGPRPASPPG